MDAERREALRVLGLRRWLWSSFFYRKWARLLHRANLHHTQKIGPLAPDGDVLHRCEWCGVQRVEYGGSLDSQLKRVAALAGEDDAQKPPQREGDYL